MWPLSENSTGMIKYHLLYDAEEQDNGETVPVTSGYFEKEVPLPYAGGMIDNPWKCKSAANYLESQWLKEPALWSQSLVSLLEIALEKHIHGNNQHMEGVIKNVKGQPDTSTNCVEPALYFYTQFEDSKATNRALVAGIERAKVDVEKYQVDNNQITSVDDIENKTKDAIENDALMTEDAVWDTGQTGEKAEYKLKTNLEDILIKICGKVCYK